jgi:lysozyme family protein
MSLFDEAFEHTVGVEGLFSDDPKDSGGATKYGITEAVARAYGYRGEMRDLSLSDAREIYKLRFWDAMRLDEIAAMSEIIALELFDTAVNQGTGAAGTYLQRSLNALNQEGKLYPDVSVDGSVGRMTVAALREYLGRRGKDGEQVMLRALNSLQGAFYIELAEKRSKDEAYVYGQLLNRVA